MVTFCIKRNRAILFNIWIIFILFVSGCGCGNNGELNDPASALIAPTTLTAEAISSSQIDLSWHDNSNDEDGFIIERALEGEDYSNVETLNTDAESYSDTGLAELTTYSYRVRAYNTEVHSEYSNQDDATTFEDSQPPSPFGIIGYGTDPSLGYTEPQVHVYYLDADNGDDISGDGTSDDPWQTLTKAREVMVSGDTIILRNGNYGYFSETISDARTDWITFKADMGDTPILTGINVNYDSITDAYLRFDNIDLQVDDSLTNYGVNLQDLRYFELRNCIVHHQSDNKYLIDAGIRIWHSDYVLIYHNHVHSVSRGFTVLDAQDVTIYGNHVHRLGGGTGIQYAGKCSNFIIEKNNIYDSNHDPADPDAPDDPHGSAISIRSNDVWIKQNIFHDIGSSSGIMFYTPDAAGGEDVYMNIIIENNLLYDIHNGSILRMYNLGTNVIVRNNTILGKVRTDTSMGCYKLHSSFSVHTIASGYDGSGLVVYNNLLAGVAVISSNSVISNNIFWSFYYDENPHNFVDSLTDNIIITSGNDYPIEYFTDGFFVGIDSESDFGANHGQTLDFRLHNDSEAINYGNTENQSIESLGSIDPDGFILPDGQARDSSHHSAGCYEY